MSRLEREWAIKLRLMGAVTKSQEALAKILENVADVTDTVNMPSAVLHEHVRVLTGMQGALLKTVAGMSWRPPVRGTPGAPWLAAAITPGCGGNAETAGAPVNPKREVSVY